MSGGKKKRRDIQTGVNESQEFTNRAIALQEPFRQQGLAANNILGDAIGLNTPGLTFQERFEASPFFEAGQNSFELDKDAINAGLANQGLAFSGANLQATADARARNFNNALAGFLGTTQGLSNQGFAASGLNANLLANQGQTQANLRAGQAATRQGVLGGISAFGNALTSVFPNR